MKDFESAEGILPYLGDLESLNLLAELRAKAGKRKESLGEFCVLGRFFMDSCGNIGRMLDRVPAEMCRNGYRCPPVMTVPELKLFMRGESYSWGSGTTFPPAYAACERCGEFWSIADCHDIVSDLGHGEASLREYEGRAMSDLEGLVIVGAVGRDTKRHGVRFIGSRYEARGPCPMSHAHMNADMVINTTGVRPAEDTKMWDGRPWFRVQNDYLIQPGDVASFRVNLYWHQACYRAERDNLQRVEMRSAFAEAGFPQVNLITIPNEYWPREADGKLPYYARPWYLAQVNEGPVFKIGWRKSVISIDWTETGKSLPDLFEGEDTTRSWFLVHAHGYNKASEYLAKLVPALEGKK